MEMPSPVRDLVHELEQIGADKITQPNYKSRGAASRAARLIRTLYTHDNVEIEESGMDSRAVG